MLVKWFLIGLGVACIIFPSKMRKLFEAPGRRTLLSSRDKYFNLAWRVFGLGILAMGVSVASSK